MTHVIRIPCEDGPEYDILVLPPEGMEIKDAITLADETVNAYYMYADDANFDLTYRLEQAGFEFLTEHTTEGYC